MAERAPVEAAQADRPLHALSWGKPHGARHLGRGGDEAQIDHRHMRFQSKRHKVFEIPGKRGAYGRASGPHPREGAPAPAALHAALGGQPVHGLADGDPGHAEHLRKLHFRRHGLVGGPCAIRDLLAQDQINLMVLRQHGGLVHRLPAVLCHLPLPPSSVSK